MFDMRTSILTHMKNIYVSLKYQLFVYRDWKEINFPSHIVSSLRRELHRHLQREPVRVQLTEQERQLAAYIQQQTTEHNRNNITRTEAYRQVYMRTPELHWSLLAHLVSRNGGWQMTDLRGEMLPHLLGQDQIMQFFTFLERSNALIFQDAYPQLLLYEESKKRNKNLFHLLPVFHVSCFMQPFWKDFWHRREPRLLTLALIINEQSYIEKRVIQNRHNASNVYNTAQFNLQAIMQLTQIVFPFYTGYRTLRYSDAAIPRLAGVIAEDFPQLQERIGIGKSLYCMLFGIPDVTNGVLHFIRETPHSGSRADYWHTIFSSEPPPRTQTYHAQRLIAGKLRPGAPPLYSPCLEDVWADQPFTPPVHVDWCTNLSVMDYLSRGKSPYWFDMTQSHLQGFNKLELAVLAKRKLAH